MPRQDHQAVHYFNFHHYARIKNSKVTSFQNPYSQIKSCIQNKNGHFLSIQTNSNKNNIVDDSKVIKTRQHIIQFSKYYQLKQNDNHNLRDEKTINIYRKEQLGQQLSFGKALADDSHKKTKASKIKNTRNHNKIYIIKSKSTNEHKYINYPLIITEKPVPQTSSTTKFSIFYDSQHNINNKSYEIQLQINSLHRKDKILISSINDTDKQIDQFSLIETKEAFRQLFPSIEKTQVEYSQEIDDIQMSY